MNKKIVKDYETVAKEVSPTRSVPFAVVEAYKAIRTNLLYTTSQSDKKSILISSSMQGEGKSTTAINIAITFSQLGEKVLLVDADLRIPTVHKKLRISNADGLSSVLVGLSTFEESVYNMGSNLDVISAGPIPPNPSELLCSQRMEEFIEAAEKIYDRIIIDSPPIGVVTDAVALGSKTAGVVLVVRGGKTTHDQVNKSLAALEFAQTKVLGVVINGGVNKNKSYKNNKYGG